MCRVRGNRGLDMWDPVIGREMWASCRGQLGWSRQKVGVCPG
jgi:hypothetical protein